MKRFFTSKDALGGGALLVLGSLAFLEATTYKLGSLNRMGPGLFPAVLSALLVILGAILLIGWYLGNVDRPAKPDVRPLLAISLSIFVFAVTIRNFGLIPAISLTTLTAASAEAFKSVSTIILLAIFLSVFCWVIFILGLGLPFAVWRLPL